MGRLDPSDEIELRAHFSECAETLHDDPNDVPQKVNTVDVPNHGAVHKTTLVAKLSANPKSGNLTWDRSLRVRYGKGSQNLGPTDDAEANERVGLFDDVALHFNEKKTPSEWRIGRVVRMRNKTRSTVDYVRPVSIHDNKCPNLKLVVNMYIQEDENIFQYRVNSHECSIGNVIMKVSMSLQEAGHYELGSNDRAQLGEFITNTSHKATTCRVRQNRSQESAVSGEGLFIREVQPLQSTATGSRTSQRKRRERLFECS